MEDCLFCRIAAGEIPSRKAYEDETVLAFYDISPAAPVHILVIPKKHIQSVNNLTEQDGELLGHMFEIVARLAREAGIADDGYRVVTNIGQAAGQSVPHLHLHLLGGRDMTWPPG